MAWAAVVPGLLWSLGCCGPWAAVVPGLLWSLGCCGPCADETVSAADGYQLRLELSRVIRSRG